MSFFQKIFKPNDGSRRDMVEQAAKARQKVEQAASRLDRIVTNRLSETIGEMLDQNDQITGRKPHVQKPRT